MRLERRAIYAVVCLAAAAACGAVRGESIWSAGPADLTFVEGAKSYHLTHRAGWRDPLAETRWERLFHDKHPQMAVKLLAVLWAGLGAGARVPAAARIGSLAELDAAARGARPGVDYDAVRHGLGLPALGGAPAQVDP